MSTLKKKCLDHFKPSKNISIDEALIKFKGRLGIVQYMPMKPDKRGIKMWMMCTSHLGYTLGFDLYSGKNSSVQKSGKGLGYDVVMHLTQKLNVGHHIYFDRFFTSVDLMIALHKEGLWSCGTVNVTRKKMPQYMKNLKLLEKNNSKSVQCIEYPNLLCTAWLDKKQIMMLSTNSRSDICEVTRRKGSEKQIVSCPSSFAVYNKNMGGVDLADQKRKYYTLSRKSSKWWIYLFSFLFDTAVNNAYIIYLTSNYPQPKQNFQLYHFKLKLIEDIVQEYNVRKRKHPEDYSAHTHERQKITGRKRTCVMCRKTGRKTLSGGQIESTWECGICKMCLCKSCFD